MDVELVIVFVLGCAILRVCELGRLQDIHRGIDTQVTLLCALTDREGRSMGGEDTYTQVFKQIVSVAAVGHSLYLSGHVVRW